MRISTNGLYRRYRLNSKRCPMAFANKTPETVPFEREMKGNLNGRRRSNPTVVHKRRKEHRSSCWKIRISIRNPPGGRTRVNKHLLANHHQ